MTAHDGIFVPNPLYARRIVDSLGRPIGKVAYHASMYADCDSLVRWRVSIFSGLALIHAGEGVESLANQLIQRSSFSGDADPHPLKPVMYFSEAEKRGIRCYLYLTLAISGGVTGLSQADVGDLLGDTARTISRTFPERLMALMPCIASLTPN